MPRLAANLSLMYCDLPFLDRFKAAASDGFTAVEYLFPYSYAPEALAEQLRANGLRQVLFNAPAGGADVASVATAWDRGERGTACLPHRQAEFRFGVDCALRYAQVLQCRQIHVMAGRFSDAADADSQLLRKTYVANLRWAAARAAAQGCDVLIEPINTRNVPSYFLNHQADAHALLGEVAASNLKVQMDLYHCQIVEGDVTTKLRRYLPTGKVAHLQIAGVPDRHEPDSGELNYRYLFSIIDALGFDGWIGCEYQPRKEQQTGGTTEGLSWAQPYLQNRT